MVFQYPNKSCGSFEIPDHWLAQSGATEFVSQQEAFAASPDKEFQLIRASEIEPPKRNPGVTGLHEDRTVSVLKALLSKTPLPPVEIKPAEMDSTFKYKVHHGYHRYHAAVALGFETIPSIIVEPLW